MTSTTPVLTFSESYCTIQSRSVLGFRLPGADEATTSKEYWHGFCPPPDFQPDSVTAHRRSPGITGFLVLFCFLLPLAAQACSSDLSAPLDEPEWLADAGLVVAADGGDCVANNVEQGGNEVCELDGVTGEVCKTGAEKDDDGNCVCESSSQEMDNNGNCVDKEDDGGDDDDRDDDDGDDDPSNGGGGNNGDDDEPRLVAFRLDCPRVERGNEGGCSVETSDTLVDMSSLSYSWKAGDLTMSGTGSSSWLGKATSTRTLSVTVSGTDIVSSDLKGTVTVTPRSWSMEEAEFDSTDGYVYDTPLEDGIRREVLGAVI